MAIPPVSAWLDLASHFFNRVMQIIDPDW